MNQAVKGTYVYGKEGDSYFVIESDCHRYLIVGAPVLAEKDGKTEDRLGISIHNIYSNNN